MDHIYFIDKIYYDGIEKNNYANDYYIFKLSGELEDYNIKVNSYIVKESKEGFRVDFTKLSKYPIKAIKTRNIEANKKYPRINLTYEILNNSFMSLEQYNQIEQTFNLYYATLWSNKGTIKEEAIFIGRAKGKYILNDLTILGFNPDGDHLANNTNIKLIKELKIKSIMELEAIKEKLRDLDNLENDIRTIKDLIPKDYELRFNNNDIKETVKAFYKSHEGLIAKLYEELTRGYNNLLGLKDFFILKDGEITIRERNF